MTMKLISFGYSQRDVPQADAVFDCRVLPNPHDDPALQGKPGTDVEVQDFVTEHSETWHKLLDTIIMNTDNDTLAFGCKGGTGRSVAVTETIARMMRATGREVEIEHLDLR